MPVGDRMARRGKTGNFDHAWFACGPSRVAAGDTRATKARNARRQSPRGNECHPRETRARGSARDAAVLIAVAIGVLAARSRTAVGIRTAGRAARVRALAGHARLCQHEKAHRALRAHSTRYRAIVVRRRALGADFDDGARSAIAGRDAKRHHSERAESDRDVGASHGSRICKEPQGATTSLRAPVSSLAVNGLASVRMRPSSTNAAAAGVNAPPVMSTNRRACSGNRALSA